MCDARVHGFCLLLPVDVVVPATLCEKGAIKKKALNATYVLVLEETQHFQLSEDALRRHERLEYVGKLLERHSTSIARIRHSPGNKQQEFKLVHAQSENSATH